MTNGNDVANVIKRRLSLLTVLVVILCCGVGGLAVWNWNTSHTARDDANRSNAALCALRGDLEKRVQNSKDFLMENPEGVPGISAKVIKDGLANQERTIKALGNLDC